MSDTRTIVIAWVDMSGFKLTGRYLDRLGLEPELRAVETARAVCWLQHGTPADLAEAEKYRAEEIAPNAVRSAVYTFDPSEGDGVMRRAREKILAAASEAAR